MRSNSHKDAVKIRLDALKIIARGSPSRTSATYIAESLNMGLRRTQRALSDLVDLGYLEHDEYNPRGFWLNKDAFKDFL